VGDVAQWVRPVARACGERSSERGLGIAVRVHLEHLAIRTMKPRHDDNFVACCDAEQFLAESRINFESRIRPLPECLVRLSKRRYVRVDHAR
jgi:hypothetical protein